MGIKRGVDSFRAAFSTGLYNNKQLTANDVRVYVDGDNLLYKGFVTSAKLSTDAERSIAFHGVRFLDNLVSVLAETLGISTRLGRRVTVVLDANQRVANKEWRIDHHPLDRERLRTIYCRLCEDRGYNVQALQEGEAELQMYLQRDRSVRLNVFVSCDTDTFSICYGHKPTIVGDRYFDRQIHTEPMSFQDLNRVSSCRLVMQDNNLRYTDDLSDYVRDSCLVLQNTRNKYYLFGMDYCADFVGYTMTAFQTLVALCGTDFTEPMFTPTMVREIMSTTKNQMDFINNQGNDIVRLTAAMVLVAIRNGATLPRSKVSSIHKLVDCPSEFYRILTDNTEQYIKYVRTGIMDNRAIEHIDMNKAFSTMINDIYQCSTGTHIKMMTRLTKYNFLDDHDDKTIVKWIKKSRTPYDLIKNMTSAATPNIKFQDASTQTTTEDDHLHLNLLTPEEIFHLENATMNVDLDTRFWSTDLQSLCNMME